MTLKKSIRLFAITVLVLWAIAALAAGPLLPYFLLQSTAVPEDYQYQTDHPYEERFIDVEEGRLNALYFPKTHAKGVVLYFHGNRRSVERWSRVADQFLQRGYAVFLPDYRGYGKSTGTLTEDRFYQDALACYRDLRRTWPDSSIAVYGRSLGSAAATYTASAANCKLLFLETPFSSIPDVASSYVPFLPRVLFFSYVLDNKHYLDKVKCPVWVVAGDRDRVVPLESSLRLKPVLKEGDEWLLIENGTHYNLRNFEEYQTALTRAFGMPRIE
jgi:pimeloyl-ACP methyl ester carboxylesterase